MDKENITAMLDAMAELVDDDMPWKDKVKAINDTVAKTEKYQIALGEFLAWFEDEDEDEEDE